MKENKFVMGEEDHTIPNTTSPPPAIQTTTASNNKTKPTRHHVKRKSSGRVHVAKLAPMARANAAQTSHTDSEADWGEEITEISSNRPTMRRSQSQRSLHRISFGGDRKGFAAITTSTHTRRKSATSQQDKIVISTPSPPSSPPPTRREDEEVHPPHQQQQQQQQNETSSSNSTTHSSSNPASLSTRVIAAPVEQPIIAIANNLVIPKNYPPIVNKSASPLKAAVAAQPNTTKQFLKSQFIPSSYDDEQQQQQQQQQQQEQLSSSLPKRYDSTFHMTLSPAVSLYNNRTLPNNTNTSVARTNSNPNMMSRTQQKLMLQRQQAQVEDETSPAHPRNMQKINKELEFLTRQYRCLKRYQDPMRASLVRCLDKVDHKTAATVAPETAAMSRLQLGANKPSMSLVMAPTMTHPPTASLSGVATGGYVPHLEQKKQIAQQRRNYLNAIALQRQQSDLIRKRQQRQHHVEEEAQTGKETDTGAVIWNATAAFLDRVFSSK